MLRRGFFSSRRSAISALDAVTNIYPIMADVSLFVFSSGEKISLQSLANGKNSSYTNQQQA